MSRESDSQIVLEGIGPRTRIFTGNPSFDQFFGIMSGTTTIMYVQNQTFSDPSSIMIEWLTREVSDHETIVLTTTYADPIAIARWCERKLPDSFKTFLKTSKQNRFWWIDIFTYRGFGDYERDKIYVGYGDYLKEIGGNPDILITPRKPEDLQSVEGLPAAVSNVITPIHGKGTVRMLLSYVDDFVDSVGHQKAMNYLRRLTHIMRKFGHTLVLVLGWRGTNPEFHTALERMVDQVLRWGYGDVPGLKQPSKFLQILKTTAPDELTTYLKVPYHMRGGDPRVGLGTPLERAGSREKTQSKGRR